MKRRKNSTQPVRDAAVLLALILLLLTVRPIGMEVVSDLIPDTEASPDLAMPADAAQADDSLADLQPILADLSGVELINLDDATELQLGNRLTGKVICRITTTDTGVDTDCSRIVAPPRAPRPAKATQVGWSDSCREKQEQG